VQAPQVGQNLSKFIETTRLDTIPAEVIAKAKLCLLDSVGCGLFGSTLEWSRSLREVVLPWGGRPLGSVLGTKLRLPAPTAALLNGLSIHGFELDDSHTQGIVHPGCVVIPAALAASDLRSNVSGPKFLEAVVVGYETSIRMGMSMGLAMLRRGLYSPSICGTFGAAAAAAKILDLTPPEIEYALRVAASQASGLYSPSLVKRLSIAFAAQKGLLSALSAKAGFRSDVDIFQDTHGGLYRALSVEPHFSAFDGLGSRYQMLNVAIKQYSCARPTFTTLDAIQSIRKEHAFDVKEIKSVVVRTTYSTMSTGSVYKVETVASALVNIPYCASVMLIDSQAFVDQFTPRKLKDKRVKRLMSKVDVLLDRKLDKLGSENRYAARVEIELLDGRIFSETVLRPSGDPQNPTKSQKVFEKYRLLASKVLNQEGVEKAERMIIGLEDVTQVGSMFKEISNHLSRTAN